MKHDVQGYKNDLKKVFGENKERSGSEIINGLASIRNIPWDDAYKILSYCRTKKFILARHVVSHSYQYSINF